MIIKKNTSSISISTDNHLPPTVNEWSIAYRPNNLFFHSIMSDISKSLDLGEPIGVSTQSELENIVATRELIAGIEFHHSEVRNMNKKKD